MARYNPDFWEIPASSQYIESVPIERSPWFETDEDRERRYALEEFFKTVLPVVEGLVDAKLTKRQREIIRLYYFCNKTQEEIAEELQLTQSTVSRHLFGTVRNGRKVGGAIPKLQKVVERTASPVIDGALAQLKTRFARSSQAA
jgi:predicted transcriptional regulator